MNKVPVLKREFRCVVKGNPKVAAAKRPHCGNDMVGNIQASCFAQEHKYIEEFSTSNFLAITKDGTMITPDSDRTGFISFGATEEREEKL